jgi:hypothetical protein
MNASLYGAVSHCPPSSSGSNAAVKKKQGLGLVLLCFRCQEGFGTPRFPFPCSCAVAGRILYLGLSVTNRRSSIGASHRNIGNHPVHAALAYEEGIFPMEEAIQARPKCPWCGAAMEETTSIAPFGADLGLRILEWFSCGSATSYIEATKPSPKGRVPS